MINGTAKILKAQSSAATGKCTLDVSGVTAQPQNLQSAGGAPIARIIENNAEYAVIQVTCSCGKTTTIKCSYK